MSSSIPRPGRCAVLREAAAEDGGGIKFFLEWDDGKNYWDKFGKYEEIWQEQGMAERVLADPLKTGRPSFPAVLVITERGIAVAGAGLLRVKICKPGEITWGCC